MNVPPDPRPIPDRPKVEGPVDVCLVLEGTYPYVAGGVSSWVHDLVHAQQHLRFHIVSLLPDRRPQTRRYEMPPNVVGLSHIYLQDMQRGIPLIARPRALMKRLDPAIRSLFQNGGLDDLQTISHHLGSRRQLLGRSVLLNSRAAWGMLRRMYEDDMPEGSFLDYFWTWRALIGGLYSVMLCDMPPARVYHTVSTGYAGLFAARAHIETGRPVILTEHGIYTNERRIEIAMADWLQETSVSGLGLAKQKRDLKDLWIDTFVAYSRCCYEASDHIITLYGGNQELQQRDGARPERMRVVPNGVDYERFSAIRRDTDPARPPTVALIGRVVPIKDVKTFIRAIGILREQVPRLRALVMGPTDEDEIYFRECSAMVQQLALESVIEFTGRVKLEDKLGGVDVIVLTSISEAQPLVILEAGAAGIPTVATDVGACREMIEGAATEDPKLGHGGAITPLANPLATAAALARLLADPASLAAASAAIRERTRLYYNKDKLNLFYRNLYANCSARPDHVPGQRVA